LIASQVKTLLSLMPSPDLGSSVLHALKLCAGIRKAISSESWSNAEALPEAVKTQQLSHLPSVHDEIIKRFERMNRERCETTLFQWIATTIQVALVRVFPVVFLW
jgi:hypothetical protein